MAKMGLTAAMLFVISNMLGSGIYMLPATLASIGGVTLIGWLVVLLGVIALALVFAKLAALFPTASGPYSYSKIAFGEFVAYQVNFIYSLANWVALVSMTTIISGYVSHIFPIMVHKQFSLLLQLGIIWLLTAVNILGLGFTKIVQSLTFCLACIPLVFLATLGWHWFNWQIFVAGWNITHLSLPNMINSSFNNIMWAFIGIESAAVAASAVKNPAKNIPLATLAGVIVAAVMYIAICTVMLGIIPSAQLQHSNAPFADVFAMIFQSKAAGIIVALIALLDCSGAMIGWILVSVNTARAAAQDRLFPHWFGRVNKHGTPVIGLLLLASVISIVVLATSANSIQEQFTKVINMSVVLYLIPYIYSAFALLVVSTTRWRIIALLAAVFCIWSIIVTYQSLSVSAFLVMMLSTVFYPYTKHATK